MTAEMTSGEPSLAAAAAWPRAVAGGRWEATISQTPQLPSAWQQPGLAPRTTDREAWLAIASRQEVAACVESALLAVQMEPRCVERRTHPRFPYPYPVYLTPLDMRGKPLAERTIAVIGRHLSVQGIDFYCPWPLAERRMVVSLDGKDAGWLGLVVELTWCRFSRHGWYDNGGRFLAVVPSPLAVSGGGRPALRC